jgi:TM2 domain-containing membrane protein YozV
LSKRKSLRDSYLLALASVFGFAGIHRFYLGKPVSGFFYLITWGWGGIGTLIDLINMPKLVDETNRQLYIEQRLDEDEYEDGMRYRVAAPQPQPAARPSVPRQEAKSLEHLALILAEENGGILTASQLALESGLPAAQAKDELEQMLIKGFATIAQRRNGNEVYVFRDFLTDAVRADLIL